MRAIVTGHSRGLGAAIASCLLAAGHDVMGVARKANAGLAARYHGRLIEVALDLADGPGLSAWLAQGELERFVADGPAMLINNAGLVRPVGPLGRQSPAEVLQAVTLNVGAPLALANAVAAGAAEGRERRIMHISSGAARSPYAGWSVYCASKAALDHHARVVALEGAAALRICSMAPGVIDTDMQGDIRATALADFPLRPRFDALKREGGLARAEDVAARLVDYLLSPAFGREPVSDLRALS